MLEAANLLPLYRRLKQLKVRLHGHTWARVCASIYHPNPPKTWWFFFVFSPRFHTKGLLACGESQMGGFASWVWWNFAEI